MYASKHHLKQAALCLPWALVLVLLQRDHLRGLVRPHEAATDSHVSMDRTWALAREKASKSHSKMHCHLYPHRRSGGHDQHAHWEAEADD